MSATRQVTLEEVSKHTSSSSCWIIIHGSAYDITKFLDDHPGGPDVVMQEAGKDATQDFEDMFHSSTARAMLKDYLVGPVEGMEQKNPEEQGGSPATRDPTAGSPARSWLIYIIPVIMAGAIYYVKSLQNST